MSTGHHKHCVFCGEAVNANWPPDPKQDFEAMICHSARNTLPADTFGRRYHAVLSDDHPSAFRRDGNSA